MKYLMSLAVIFLPFLLTASIITNKIVVDQFGYRPQSKKVAVLRNPITGKDAGESYSPGATFAVIRVSDGTQVLTGAPTVWSSGSEDASSGDKAWWFDFSTLTANGAYYILDIENDLRSFEFEIKEDIYNEVLKHAVRVFFYQRSGHDKDATFAGTAWTDEASHLKDLQDLNCRKWNTPNEVASERDVHGGWYDAGDYNKYTVWTSNYVVELLRAYQENPDVWTDDYNIPESGNGIPDILDEVKWGVDHLLRLQLENGSCIAIVDADQTSPPSLATGPSLYGDVNTIATLSAAGAYALASKIYGDIGQSSYASTLEQAAINAWNWADANPNVLWMNNDASNGTQGIGAGQQEGNDYDRFTYKMRAASFLYDITGQTVYDDYFATNYQNFNMFLWYNTVQPFQSEGQDVLLHHATITSNSTVSSGILSSFEKAMNKEHEFQAVETSKDPYMAHLKDYTWGSNNQKCSSGLQFWEVDYYLGNAKSSLGLEAAEDYIHYIHGVNPNNYVYLTNMGAYGAENSVNQMFHDWFKYDSPLWNEAGVSTYGPAPGFVTGGPNPSYSLDACCPSSCGSTENNAKCSAVDVSGLLNQPDQKSYLDFNESWPMNSWEITEPSMGYQVEYIRLLSKFVARPLSVSQDEITSNVLSLKVYPSPTSDFINVVGAKGPIRILDINGKLLSQHNQPRISINQLSSGIYFIENNGLQARFVKK